MRAAVSYREFGNFLPAYTASHSKREKSSNSPLLSVSILITIATVYNKESSVLTGLTSIERKGLECVELYLHLLMPFHGVVINYS
jgi:hypothetical protein